MQSAWDVPRTSMLRITLNPLTKAKNSAETRSVPVRIVNLEIEKDDICHPLKA